MRQRRYRLWLIVMGLFFMCISCASALYDGLGKERNYSINRYGQIVAKATGTKLLIVGDVTDAYVYSYKNIPSYCMSFSSPHTHTLNEARVFATKQVYQFWVMLQHDEEVDKYAKSNHKILPKSPEKAVLQLVGYKITYWDENFERRPAPWIRPCVERVPPRAMWCRCRRARR